MKLLSCGVWGYRRFGPEEPNMDVAASVVAVVGPNEAGKSSFLRALRHLNGPGPFDPNEFTRGGKGQACVRATFGLTADDREALQHVPEARALKTFELWKRESGALHGRTEPLITRSLKPRAAARQRVTAASRLRALQDDEDGLALLGAAVEILGLESETLIEDQLEVLRGALATLERREVDGATVSRAHTALEIAVANEEREAPQLEVNRLLTDRRPEFLLFEEAHRELPAVHVLREEPPVALQNLLALADLDRPTLVEAVDRADEATVEELVVAANDRLQSAFASYWSQARVSVRFRVTQDVLHVLVTSAPGHFISIAERSDGFRQFVALIAYVERYAAREDLVLMIDEAEMHLHYNAQADFVRVLTYQNIAGKVIYSTHSAGCLPEDLGVGVRLIEPIGPPEVDQAGWEHSRVQNRVWGRPDLHGAYSPLLIAMGASTFAFSAARYAVITEGLTDAMLLPTLLREVTGREAMGYQVAPGISEASPETLAALDLSAARVIYLTDGDSDGVRLHRRLIDAGVPRDRILALGGGRSPLSLEDLLRPDAYLKALNAELSMRHGVEMPAGSLPRTGRAAAARSWLRQELGSQDVDISKRAVVQRLLESPGPLVAGERKRGLQSLHRQIAGLFGLADT